MKVFAVLRFENNRAGRDLSFVQWKQSGKGRSWSNNFCPQFAIVKVVKDKNKAIAEVNRLNKLKDSEGYFYFWQATNIE